VELHQLTEVNEVIVENGKVTGVNTNRGKITCGCAIQAVSGHSSLLAAKAGFKLPIKTYPLQAMVTLPVKPFLNPLVSSPSLHCYVQQTGRGELVFGGGSDPYPLYSTRSTLDLKESLLANAVELFPFMANARLLRQWGGLTDMTTDYSPIMGLSPVENYYLDAGWGTWGFKATPICGKTMAELVASGGKVPDLIKPFSMNRFDSFRQVNEMGATAASH
jgi:sarcosine oxidase subunit beta